MAYGEAKKKKKLQFQPVMQDFHISEICLRRKRKKKGIIIQVVSCIFVHLLKINYFS